MEDKKKIQKEAILLISKFGLRNLNMDQLAKNMGISKTTIYKSFLNKDYLVLGVIEHIMDRLLETIANIVKKDINPVTKLLEIYACIFKVLIKVNPHFFIELKKLFPLGGQYQEDKKKIIIEEVIKPLLSEAIEKGYFEENIDQEFLITIHQLVFDSIQNSGYSLLNTNSAELVFDYLFVKNFKGFLKEGQRHIIDNFSYSKILHGEIK